ncbi:DUF6270 domain-containing protein [Glutamicibacter ardleyensis]|uniref:DUF6270 domain-containing protein n=1 Tax=Glutamicibacter ardleyensis TaxID=225894 RepID=UPI003FD14082
MKKVFLYGGCVIRDSYELIREDIGLSGYVARQSLISAMYPATTVLPEAKLKSPFQQRMANDDIQSSLYPTIRRKKDDTNLFVMDFHIERLGVHRLADGSFITRSAEIMNSNVLDSVPNLGPAIRVGSKHHTIAFTNAANKLIRRFEMLDIKDRVLVVNAPWADKDDAGIPFEPYRGKPVRELSDGIEALTRIFADNGVRVITLPEELAVGEANHKWQRAPFHYRSEAMLWIAEQIKIHL